VAGFSYAYPKAITTFAFLFQPNHDDIFCDIDHDSGVITCDSMPAGTDITNLSPYIEINGESVNPGTGIPQDFTLAVDYIVTAPIDGSTKTYTVGPLAVKVGFDVLGRQARIWPNPASGYLNLEFPGHAHASARLLDQTGRVVLGVILESDGKRPVQLPLPDECGVYMLEVTGQDLYDVLPVIVGR
jgi:hypothetical protein